MPNQPILVIDDETDTIEFIRIMFSMRGREVIGAVQGEEGLRLARELQPAAILLDVMMPEMNGFEVCRRLRADPVMAHIPIVILSARASPIDQAEGVAVGADQYVVKPINVKALAGLVETLIAKRASA